MIKALRITNSNWSTLMAMGFVPNLITLTGSTIGKLLVWRPNDTVIMDSKAFDYQYEFVGPEFEIQATEVRVKDTPEARAELLKMQEEREALMQVISAVLNDDYALDNVPNEIGEALADKLIEEGWHKECE